MDRNQKSAYQCACSNCTGHIIATVRTYSEPVAEQSCTNQPAGSVGKCEKKQAFDRMYGETMQSQAFFNRVAQSQLQTLKFK